MSHNIDFNDIRPLGSLNEGFEELVCQLAHRMEVPGGKRFVRNGRPDGGAECYWVLEGGTVIMEVKDGAYEPIQDCDVLKM